MINSCIDALLSKNSFNALKNAGIWDSKIPYYQKYFSGKEIDYYTGIDEQIIFPEVDYDKVNEIRGMDCTIVTNTDNDDYAYALIKAFGFPIKDRKSSIKDIDSSSDESNDTQVGEKSEE